MRACTPRPLLEIVDASPRMADAVALMGALDEELRARYPGAPVHPLTEADLADARLIFVVAYAAARAAGCGAVRTVAPGVGEIKRMFVRADHRGAGIGRHLLRALEARAIAAGLVELRLETGDAQPEAMGLYRAESYRDAAPLPGAAAGQIRLAKRLDPPPHAPAADRPGLA